jgi:hypothetical protein
VRILDAVKNPDQRLWYIQQTIANNRNPTAKTIAKHAIATLDILQ